jgi:hypothetical protein
VEEKMTPNRETATAKKEAGQQESHGEQATNLSYRYGSIGIEAVAAAVRYAGSPKNPAYAPAAQRVDERFLEPAV